MMFIWNERGCNQTASEADTLLLYVTLISRPQWTILIFVETKSSSTPRPHVSIKGFVSVRVGRRSAFIALSFTSPTSLSKTVTVGEKSYKKTRRKKLDRKNKKHSAAVSEFMEMR